MAMIRCGGNFALDIPIGKMQDQRSDTLATLPHSTNDPHKTHAGFICTKNASSLTVSLTATCYCTAKGITSSGNVEQISISSSALSSFTVTVSDYDYVIFISTDNQNDHDATYSLS